jgi:plastocyanin
MGESPAPLLSRALGLKAPGKAVKERKPMKTFRRTFRFAVLALLASGPAFGAIHTNTITGLSFVPRNMTIKAGDTIVWVNVAFHSVTGSSAQEPFCGSTIFGASDVSCSATFSVPGTYNYYCRPHWMYNMTGSVTVQPVFGITDIRPSFRTNLIVTWDGSPGPYALQKKEDLGEAGWRDLVIDSAQTATVRNEVNQGIFRIEDIATLTNVPFSAYMSGAMERPVVTTAGTGFGTFRLAGNTLHFDIRYENLSSLANNAHIHGPAPASLGAGVLVDLGAFNGGAWGTSGTLAGSVNLTPAVRNAVLAGKTYVNIHTVNNGDGEIRGQIAPVLMQAAISGPAERPPRPSLGKGQGTFFLVGTNLTFNITYSGLLSAADNAHIHGPADTADSAGVMRDLVAFHDGPLAALGSFGGTMGLTPQQLANVLDGLTYVNIHTPNFPQGEVRGQITPKVSAIPLSASLTGDAEKPSPVTTPGTGIASFRIEGNNLHFEVRYKDLTSVATDAHIHGPADSTNDAAPIIFLASYSIGPLGTSGALAGTVALTAQQKTMILNGQTYINIHTANNPGGEIRGQVGTVLMTSRLDGAQAGVTTSGIGSSALLVVGDRLTFEITYRNLTGTANDAHIHGPAPVGQGAGVLFDLVPFHNGAFGTSGSFTGTGTLSPSVLGYVIDGLTYINIHSSFADGGEIRGQVIR